MATPPLECRAFRDHAPPPPLKLLLSKIKFSISSKKAIKKGITVCNNAHSIPDPQHCVRQTEQPGQQRPHRPSGRRP